MSSTPAHILITGGTGSLGRALVHRLLQEAQAGTRPLERLIIFSRDEYKQRLLKQEFATHPLAATLRFHLGNVRNQAALRHSMRGVQLVIHTAAHKYVDLAESNPWECLQTNVTGAQNVIEAAIDAGVPHVIAISSDKAVAPGGVYGASKLAADSLFQAAHIRYEGAPTCFKVIRFGNFFASRGSIVPFFLKQQATGRLPITHAEMTRFHLELVDAVSFLLEHATVSNYPGLLIAPRMRSFLIKDLATAVCPNCEQPEVGLRPGEKLHDELIVPSSSLHTLACADHFAELPHATPQQRQAFAEQCGGQPVPAGHSLSSAALESRLSVAELREILARYTQPE